MYDRMKPNTTSGSTPLILRALQFSFRYLGPIFPRYFSRRAYQIWFTPPRFSPPEIEQRALTSVRSSVIEVNGSPIKLYHWGEGPTVLFIHGWSGRGTQAVHFIEQICERGYSVLSFDAPAHGASPGKTTDIFKITDTVTAIYKAHGGFHAAITHSFGGMILPFAMTQGVRVGRIAMVCPVGSVASLLRNFQRQLCMPDSVLQLMKDQLYHEYNKDLDQRLLTASNVSALSIPGLVFHDEDDTEMPWQDGQQIVDAWPNARFVMTHGLGHRRILRDAETVRAITDFVTQT